MAGTLTWWANRKSRFGLSPIAKEPPPKSPGKPWWTDPPTTLPQPEYIEYVAQFQAQLTLARPSAKRNAMQEYVANWLRTARRLLHEEMQSPDRADLHTTDGLIVSASSALQKMRSLIYGLGGEVTPDVQAIVEAVHRRAEKLRRERAIEAAKTNNGVQIRRAL